MLPKSDQPATAPDSKLAHVEDLDGPKLEVRDNTFLALSETDKQDVEGRIRRKFDLHILPLVWVLFVLSYLDRGNIGNAKTAGAQDDLGLNSDQWAWVLLSFYITYTCLEWLLVFWKLFPAHIWVTSLCIGWGIAAMATGAVHNLAGLIACRCVLAVFEAGYGVGVPYYLSMMYKRHELGIRLAFILGSSPIANCFASALAYGISHIRSSLEPWRLIFLIEGAPTILCAPIVWFFLADSVDTAKFLTQAERTYAIERLETRDTTKKSRLSRHQLLAGLGDYKAYVHAFIHFCCNYSFAALSNFLPTIVKNMGYSSVNAQGLTAPPYLAAFICSILAAWVSDRFSVRGYAVTFSAAVATVGYALLASQHGTAARYIGVWLASCGIFPALAINMTWMLNNQAGDTKRGVGMSLLAIIGQTSSFVASKVFPSSDAPYFVTGTAIGSAVSGAIVIAALFLHFMFVRFNKKKDREFGPVSIDQGQMDVSKIGEKHPSFRLLT